MAHFPYFPQHLPCLCGATLIDDLAGPIAYRFRRLLADPPERTNASQPEATPLDAHRLNGLAALLVLAQELEQLEHQLQALLPAPSPSETTLLADLNLMAQRVFSLLQEAFAAFLERDPESPHRLAYHLQQLDSLFHIIYYSALDLVSENQTGDEERLSLILRLARHLTYVAHCAAAICCSASADSAASHDPLLP